MEDLLLQETESTPEIQFRISGQMVIKGKSLPEDPKRFYNPLFKWAEELSAENVQLDIKLEYVNTSSSKNILELIKLVDQNKKIRHLNLNWYYEVDDLDMLEFGEVVQRSVKRTKTQYLECDDIEE